MLMSVFHPTVQFVPCQSNNMQQGRHCRGWNHDHSQRCCLLCAELWWSAVSRVAGHKEKTLQTDTSWNWYWEWTLLHIHQKTTFLLRATVAQIKTLPM